VKRPEENKPLGRPKSRWEDNIKMGLQEAEWKGRDWTDVALDKDKWRAFVNFVMDLRVP
jgi:hypothetical protein